MRKVIVSLNTTLDGFMSGPHCELDWHFKYWTPDMGDALCTQLSRADTILLGRITFNAMAAYWPAKIMDTSSSREDIAFANMMNCCEKIVFSKTLSNVSWSNSRIATRSLAAEIKSLKGAPGRDIIVYGSGKLIASLVKNQLPDEYQVWVHPVFLGRGKPFFECFTQTLQLKLLHKQAFTSGVVLLTYHSENI
ncbi:MAG: dihydrofolate reductase family protein [Ginsengibacter sp.]